MEASWEKFREGLFGLFYVMTERRDRHKKQTVFGALRLGFLFLVDMGQVLRVLLSTRFGWNPGVANYIPAPKVPGAIFFIIAVSLVFLAIMDAALVLYIFQVTTFFTSILTWLLFPLRCGNVSAAGGAEATGDGPALGSLSEWLRGDGAACTPWGSAEAGVTAGALALALAFAVFSLATSLLDFEVNPLGQGPGDKATGRVEALWSGVRACVVAAGFAGSRVLKLICVVVVTIQAAAVLAAHVQILPFHSHTVNMLRGAIYALVAWSAASTAVVCSLRRDGDGSEAVEFTGVHQTLLFLAPFAWFGGAGLVAWKKAVVLETVRRLRLEFERSAAAGALSSTAASAVYSGGASAEGPRGGGRRDSESMALVPAKVLARRGDEELDEFYDARLLLSPALESPRAAWLALRLLLYQRDQRDVQLMHYMFERSLEEHPKAHTLLVLHLMFMRFVFKDVQTEIWHQKLSKMLKADLALDLKFAMYAVDRRAMQYSAGVNLGKDTISAINLMDVSSKLAHVRKQHQECMNLLKVLWRTALASKRDTSLARAQELAICFDRLGDLVSHTDKCYADLLVKFPGSASLHLDYAEFCEVVLNDPVKAANQRHGAELLETDGGDAGEEGKSQSKSNSTATSHRAMQRQFVESWLRSVMGQQATALARLRWLVGLLGFLLVIFSTCAFIIQDNVLMSTVTEARLGFLQRSLGYRQNAIHAGILTRDLFLADAAAAAVPESAAAAAVERARALLLSQSAAMGAVHTLNYVSPPSQACLEYFLRSDITERVVAPGLGRFVDHTTNFWELINHFVSTIAVAGKVDLADLQSPDYSATSMSVAKRQLAFMFDNMWTIANAMDRYFDQLSSEIMMLQEIIDRVVASLLSVHLLSLFLFSYLVVRNVRQVFPTCQHTAISSDMVHALPLSVLRKVHRYYVSREKSMAALSDEATAKENTERGEEGPRPLLLDINESGPRCDLHEVDVHSAGSCGPTPMSLRSRQRLGEAELPLQCGGGHKACAGASRVGSSGGGRGLHISFARQWSGGNGGGDDDNGGWAVHANGLAGLTARLSDVRVAVAGSAPRRGSLRRPSLSDDADGCLPAIAATGAQTKTVSQQAIELENNQAYRDSGPRLLPLTARNLARLAAQSQLHSERNGGQSGGACGDGGAVSTTAGADASFSASQSALAFSASFSAQATAAGCVGGTWSPRGVHHSFVRRGDCGAGYMGSARSLEGARTCSGVSGGGGEAFWDCDSETGARGVRGGGGGGIGGSGGGAELSESESSWEQEERRNSVPCLVTLVGRGSSMHLGRKCQPSPKSDLGGNGILAAATCVVDRQMPPPNGPPSPSGDCAGSGDGAGCGVFQQLSFSGLAVASNSSAGDGGDVAGKIISLPRSAASGIVAGMECTGLSKRGDDGYPKGLLRAGNPETLRCEHCTESSDSGGGVGGGNDGYEYGDEDNARESEAGEDAASRHSSGSSSIFSSGRPPHYIRPRGGSPIPPRTFHGGGGGDRRGGGKAAAAFRAALHGLMPLSRPTGAGARYHPAPERALSGGAIGSDGSVKAKARSGQSNGQGGVAGYDSQAGRDDCKPLEHEEVSPFGRAKGGGRSWLPVVGRGENGGAGGEAFSLRIKEASRSTLSWYFRTPVYLVALSMVLGLTFTLWLAPCRVFPLLINTARLIRANRNAGASLLECVFLSRELVLNDGFARINASSAHERLLRSRSNYEFQMENMRRGGALVSIGADQLGSEFMNSYDIVMYGTGCPWRKNTSDCTVNAYPQAASDGLYKYLLAYQVAITLVSDKYIPAADDPLASRSSFDWIVTNQSRRTVLDSDADLQFLIEGELSDVLLGLGMLQQIFQDTQQRLLTSVHEEIKIYISLYIMAETHGAELYLVVMFLYALLFRTAMGAAQREIDKTRNFVTMIPAYVLTREDADWIRLYFVGAQGQDEDAEDETLLLARDCDLEEEEAGGGSGSGGSGRRCGSGVVAL